MAIYNDIERVLKEQGERGVEHLMYYSGINLSCHRQLKNDAYSQVHGRNASGATTKVKNFVGLLHGDDFFQSSDSYSGNFTHGYLYVNKEECDIIIGDVIQIESEDLKQRRYKIDKEEKIGLTTEIFKKFKIINIGD